MTKSTISKCHFDDMTGIFYKEYFGKITVDDIKSSWEEIFENDLIPKTTKGFIIDYRQANFSIKPQDSSQIVEFYRQHINKLGGFKFAIIVESFKDVIIPILVSHRDKGYESSPFSTVEAAVNWVLD